MSAQHMNFSNMALFVVHPPRRPPVTGSVSVFASLMGSIRREWVVAIKGLEDSGGSTWAKQNFLRCLLNLWRRISSLVMYGFSSEDRCSGFVRHEMERQSLVCQEGHWGVFGILKKRFLFLENFVNLHRQSSIGNCFTTCCILHNMLLQTDGFLDESLPAFPSGVEYRLGQNFGNAWNGQDRIWNRYEDNTVDELLEEEYRCRFTVLTPHVLAIGWVKVMYALVDHHEFARQANWRRAWYIQSNSQTSKSKQWRWPTLTGQAD